MVIKDRPVCTKCGSRFVYVLRNGDVVCRGCGNVDKK
jgi:ribosomal protein L37AE/L43A